MRSTTLGATGPAVSPIGLGLAAIGRPGYINLGHSYDLATGPDLHMMWAQAHDVLDEAWRLGVRYFDAARSYGRAEDFLGSWLSDRRINPTEVTIGSKWGYTYTADWKVNADRHEVKDHSLATLDRQWIESNERFGEHLDLYQIHSATIESGVLNDHHVLGRLAQLKADGVRIGLSTTGPRQSETIRRAIGIEVDGSRLFDAVQATWNLLEPSSGPALLEAHDAGLGVIIKEALANARLTARNEDPQFATSRTRLQAEATRLGTTLDALALAAAIAQPWADVVLSGAASLEHLRSNVQATTVPWDDQATTTLGSMAESPEAYWSHRSRLAWN